VTDTGSDVMHTLPWRFWVGVAALGVAVLLTVGWAPALLAVGILLLDRFVLPGRHLVATCAVVALGCLPILWFAGSSLPLMPPSARIQDNTWTHQMGGLAVWLVFVAAWIDRAGSGEPDGTTATEDDQPPPRRSGSRQGTRMSADEQA
jgi:hypothetical protein